MRRRGYTTPAHRLRPLHVFTGRESAGTALPPVRTQLILRWCARATSVLVLGFVAAFLIGNGLDLTALRPLEWTLMGLLAGTCLGLVLAWRWEGWGGALSLVCLGGFHLVQWASTGIWPGGWAFPVVALPGVLFVAARLRGFANRRAPAPPGDG